MTSAYSEILKRIEAAIGDARAIFARFTPGAIDAEFKAGHDPVTEADRAIDAVLRQNLLRDGEGWLSEESVDDFSRLEKVERLGRRSSRWNARICKGHSGVLRLDWLRREWPSRGRRNSQPGDQRNVRGRDRYGRALQRKAREPRVRAKI